MIFCRSMSTSSSFIYTRRNLHEIPSLSNLKLPSIQVPDTYGDTDLPTKMVTPNPNSITSKHARHPLTNPEQRLLRNTPPHAPTPTSRPLRRIHPPPHLHGINILQLPTTTQHIPTSRRNNRRASRRRNIRLLDPPVLDTLLPPYRRHLRRAAVPAAEPGRRGRRGAGSACCIWDYAGDGAQAGGGLEGFGA